MKTYAEHKRATCIEYLAQVLALADGNVTRAAMLAGLHRTYMHSLLKDLGVRLPSPSRQAKIVGGIHQHLLNKRACERRSCQCGVIRGPD